MSIFGTALDLFNKLFGKIPIQNRRERWKNDIDNLTKERKKLINGVCTEKTADRIMKIDEKIAYLNQLMKNSVDS